MGRVPFGRASLPPCPQTLPGPFGRRFGCVRGAEYLQEPAHPLVTDPEEDLGATTLLYKDATSAQNRDVLGKGGDRIAKNPMNPGKAARFPAKATHQTEPSGVTQCLEDARGLLEWKSRCEGVKCIFSLRVPISPEWTPCPRAPCPSTEIHGRNPLGTTHRVA